MESLPLSRAGRASRGQGRLNKPPLRFAYIYFSNGVEPIHWWAKGSGAAMEFGPAAQPLAPIREDIVFVRGLYTRKRFTSTSPHLGRMNLLSGATVSLDPNEIRVGTTFDQMLAQRIGNQTAVPSLALGIEPNELRLEDGVSMIYGSCDFLGLADQAGDQGNLSRRARSINWSAMARAGSSTAAFSTPCSQEAHDFSRKSAAATAGSSTNIWSRSATSRNASSTRPRRSASKAGGRR